jgi:hypothetical protein
MGDKIGQDHISDFVIIKYLKSVTEELLCLTGLASATATVTATPTDTTTKYLVTT